MNVNTTWLAEYLPAGVTDRAIVDALPRVGLEIEHGADLSVALTAVKVGFVREKTPVAGQPDIFATKIEIEPGRFIPVVCGSDHPIEIGWGVPVAEAGTKLPGGREIKLGYVYGVESTGMICLDGELGILTDHNGSGLRVFTDEATLGKPVPSVLPITGHLVEVNVLPNRPDCLGLIGIAREVAAILGVTMRTPDVSLPPSTGSTAVPVQILDAEMCPRYRGGAVTGLKVQPSPGWLKTRLLIAGMRPINNVVDVTNYVLYEWGQPLHAFDLRKLNGPRIEVRRIKPGESLELLTGKTVTGDKKYSQQPLVIADGAGPVALAGIMGGGATKADESTVDVLLEAATFDPIYIRKAVKEIDLGLETRGTASSYRYERGTDPNTVLSSGFGRALRLLCEPFVGGTLAGAVDVYPAHRQPRELRMSAKRTSSYLGRDVSADAIKSSLTKLGMTVADDLAVTVPTWRVDATDPVVLIEDVARIIGYDSIPTAPAAAHATRGRRSPADQLRQKLSAALIAAGFFETRTPPLEMPENSAWLGEPAGEVTLTNSQSIEMSVLRRSLLPGLAKVVDTNIRRGATSVRFFEIDRTFDRSENGRPGRYRVTAVAGGPVDRFDWRGQKSFDFHVIKGIVEDVLEFVGCPPQPFRPTEHPAMLPGTMAEIGSIGVVGEIDPAKIVIDRQPFRLFAFELDLAAILSQIGTVKAYKPLPRFQAVTRDLAIVVPVTTEFAAIESAIAQSAGALIESVTLVDRFQGAQVPPGHHSLAFRLQLRADRTLTADEVAATIAGVIDALVKRFSAVLRA